MSEFEFYFSQKPTNHEKNDLKRYLTNKKLNLGVQGHLSNYEIQNANIDLVGHMKQSMVRSLSEGLMPKMKWETRQSPSAYGDGISVRGQVLVMTEEELIELLGHFGVTIYHRY